MTSHLDHVASAARWTATRFTTARWMTGRHAAMLQIAHMLKHPCDDQATILFVAVSAEEKGLLNALLRAHPTVAADKIVATSISTCFCPCIH
jgi:hypothetical protein